MAKIQFNGYTPETSEEIARNIANSKASGLPVVRELEAHDRRLAVVGGGPSILDHVEELRDFDEIWAINGAGQWLRARGIESVAFSIDPSKNVAALVSGASKALLSMRIDPSVLGVLKDADIELFSMALDEPDGIMCCSSTATAAFHLAVLRGHRSMVFFGCEGSFNDSTHAYAHEERDDLLVVECGSGDYLTAPDFYQQSLELSGLIKPCRPRITERSGGLLRAMVENDDHDITQVSRALMEKLTPRGIDGHLPQTP